MDSFAKLYPLPHEVVKKAVKIRLDFTRAIFEELEFNDDGLEMRI